MVSRYHVSMEPLTETISIRVPKGTTQRTEAFLAPRQSIPAFWREKMLEWLKAAEEKK